MKEIINGEKIYLRPMSMPEKELFFRWATRSDSTPYWYGENYDDTIPAEEEFFEDWKDFYFDGSQPMKGRSFIIIKREDDTPIGQINYQKDEENSAGESYDLDIIIASDYDKNKGYGSEAIRILVNWLCGTFQMTHFSVHALSSNTRAIKAYKKAGFAEERKYLDKRLTEWIKLTLKIK